VRIFAQCDGMQAEWRIGAIKLGAEGGAPVLSRTRRVLHESSIISATTHQRAMAPTTRPSTNSKTSSGLINSTKSRGVRGPSGNRSLSRPTTLSCSCSQRWKSFTARHPGHAVVGVPLVLTATDFVRGGPPISSGEVSMENREARDRDERRKALGQFSDADDTTGSRPLVGSRRSDFPRAHSELRLASRPARTTCVWCFQTCACLTPLRCGSAWSGFPSIRGPYVGFTPS